MARGDHTRHHAGTSARPSHGPADARPAAVVFRAVLGGRLAQRRAGQRNHVLHRQYRSSWHAAVSIRSVHDDDCGLGIKPSVRPSFSGMAKPGKLRSSNRLRQPCSPLPSPDVRVDQRRDISGGCRCRRHEHHDSVADPRPHRSGRNSPRAKRPPRRQSEPARAADAVSRAGSAADDLARLDRPRAFQQRQSVSAAAAIFVLVYALLLPPIRPGPAAMASAAFVALSPTYTPMLVLPVLCLFGQGDALREVSRRTAAWRWSVWWQSSPAPPRTWNHDS